MRDLVGQSPESKKDARVLCVWCFLSSDGSAVLANSSQASWRPLLDWKAGFLTVAQFNNRNGLWKTFLSQPSSARNKIHCCSLDLFGFKRNVPQSQPPIPIWFLRLKPKHGAVHLGSKESNSGQGWVLKSFCALTKMNLNSCADLWASQVSGNCCFSLEAKL